MPEITFRFQDYLHPLQLLRLRRRLERSQWYSPAEMERYQLRRLRLVLKAAYANVPYYRSLFQRLGIRPSQVRELGDLARLPALTKEALVAEQQALTSRKAAAYAPHLSHTSGTTSQPVSFYLDKHSRVLEFVYYWRHWSWAGYRLGDRFAQLNAQHFLDNDDDSVSHFQPLVNRLLLNANQLASAQVDSIARALRRYQPKFLKGVAGPIYYLAELFAERGIRDVSFRAIFSTGEMMFPSRRRVIESVFGCKVLDSYGLIEQAAAISQCPAGGYHINSDYSLVELEPREGPTASGQQVSALFGTTLYNLAMPLLRYEISDLVETYPDVRTCSCGRTLPLVKRIHGRSDDAVVTPDGRIATAFFMIPESVDGAKYTQFVQEDERTLVARVVPLPSFDTAQQEQFLAYTRRLVGPSMKLSLALVSEEEVIKGPGGKVPLVITSEERGRVPDE